jgi:hypothetical protein
MKVWRRLATIIVVVIAGVGIAASGAEVVFADGAQVNVFNSWGTTSTASVNPAAAAFLLDGIYDQSQWVGGTANGTQVTINLGTSQTVSKFRTYSWNGVGSEVSNVILESSADGATWAPVAGASYSLVGSNEAQISLASPVTAKAFRLTRDDSSGITWRLSYIRAYGVAGALPAGHMDKDLITTSAAFHSRSGYTGEEVYGAPHTDNPVNLDDHRYLGFHGIDPAKNWNQTWLQFKPNGGDAVTMGGIGLTFDSWSGAAASTMHFQVHVSDTPSDYNEWDSRWSAGLVPDFSGSPLALDYNGPVSSAVNYFAFPYPVTGSYIRIDFLSVQNSSGAEIATRFGNIMVFQHIPEPASMLLIGFGGLALLARRRGRVC